MANFSHLQTLDVKADNTAKYPLDQIEVNGVSPVLTVAPATEANKPYFNSLIKRAQRYSKQVTSNKINAGLIEENREEDRRLFPMHVLKGWEDMLDANGKPIQFNPQNAREFIDALPDWLFDDIRNFCTEVQNFVQESSIRVDVNEVGKK